MRGLMVTEAARIEFAYLGFRELQALLEEGAESILARCEVARFARTAHPCTCKVPNPQRPGNWPPGSPLSHDYQCPQDLASGNMCREHFGQQARKWQQAECPNCQIAQRQHKERIQRDHTIDPSARYGEHIPLTCELHPEARWHTKNIDYIGARTIFDVRPCACERPRLIPA